MDRLLRTEATDGRAQMARAAAVLFGLASVVNLLGVAELGDDAADLESVLRAADGRLDDMKRAVAG